MSDDSKIGFPEVWGSWLSYLGPIENIELAEVCEVSSAAVTGWINGSKNPRESKLKLISNFLFGLINDQQFVVTPHNRKDFSTITTTYRHMGNVPSPSDILSTFMGVKSVSEVLRQESRSESEQFVEDNSLAMSQSKRLNVKLGIGVLVVSVLAVLLIIQSSEDGDIELTTTSENGDQFTIRRSSDNQGQTALRLEVIENAVNDSTNANPQN